MRLTRDQAIMLYKSEVWRDMTKDERAEQQLAQDRLFMPFDVFHEAVEHRLGRPVYTHEFGSAGRAMMLKEMFGGADPPMVQDLIEMIPEGKRIVVLKQD